MNSVHFQHHTFHVEDVSIPQIVEHVGTPVYIYSARQITGNFQQFKRAFREVPHLICYAVKANSGSTTPEVLVKGDEFFVIRTRETYEDLTRGEEI